MATPKTTPFKMWIECHICVDLFSTPLSVWKLAQTKYAMTPFSIKGRYERLATAVHVIENCRTSSFNVGLQMTDKKYTKSQNARAKSLFCTLNLVWCRSQWCHRRGLLKPPVLIPCSRCYHQGVCLHILPRIQKQNARKLEKQARIFRDEQKGWLFQVRPLVT